jgi:hypothetical protein
MGLPSVGNHCEPMNSRSALPRPGASSDHFLAPAKTQGIPRASDFPNDFLGRSWVQNTELWCRPMTAFGHRVRIDPSLVLFRGRAAVIARMKSDRQREIGAAALSNLLPDCMLRTSRRRSALVAQLDRAPDFESGGRGFESLRARHLQKGSIPDTWVTFYTGDMGNTLVRRGSRGVPAYRSRGRSSRDRSP